MFWTKDGKSVPVEYTSTPIIKKDKVIGAVVVFRDITERKKAEKELNDAFKEIKKLKDELLNNVMHVGC